MQALPGHSKWDNHRELISKNNHLGLLSSGKGLERMARPSQVRSQRQQLEKQIAGLQSKLTVLKTDERHVTENKPKTNLGKR